jgi:predicted nucleic acid-binding protein
VKLVVDASVAVAASVTPVGFTPFRGIELVAPPLLWIEVVSALHAAMWRGELRRDQAEPMLQRVLAAPIARMEPESLPIDSWAVADELAGPRPTTPSTSRSLVFSSAASSRLTRGCVAGPHGSGS